jgi:aspartate aminotransferase, cytoplasmic
MAATLAPLSTEFVSAFTKTPRADADPILGLSADFKADTDPSKVNLGVGAYRDNDGKPYVLPVVRRVEQKLAADLAANHEYLPQQGLAAFSDGALKLLLGEDSPAIATGRVATVQALSGTGALRVAFDFMYLFGPCKADTKVYIPKPTWSNHWNIVKDAGLTGVEYRYFNPATGGVDISAVLEDLAKAPAGSVVLLHACAHNPTGADPTFDEWTQIMRVVAEARLIPLFDNAYQGFASGDLHTDGAAIRSFVTEGSMDILSCQSFAKNAGLYGERIGAFSIICSAPAPVPAIQSQLARIIRGLYSSPPLHGAAIMASILGDKDLFAEWQGELVIMSNRIKDMRRKLKAALDGNKTPGGWDRILSQIGMFSFTVLTPQQVKYMRDNYHIYMSSNGRISMAGLNDYNVQYVADAIDAAMRNVAKQD